MRTSSCLAFLLLATAVCLAKRDYRIELRSAQVKSMDREYFGEESTVAVVMVNDSVSVLDGKLVFAKDFPSYSFIVFDVFKKSPDKEWVKHIEQTKDFFCYYLGKYLSLTQNILQYDPESCTPMKDDVWAFARAQLDPENFPEDVPEGQWKLDIHFTGGRSTVITFEVFADTVKTAA